MTGDLRDVPVLEGRLVRLEPLEAAHLPGLCKAAQDGRERFALTDVPADEEGMRAYVERALTGRHEGTMVPFAVLDHPGGEVVGTTRFCYFEYWRWPPGGRPRPADDPDAAQIGYTWLAGRTQRTGLNREAKLLLLRVAFERWRLTRVTLRTDARNLRSRRAIEALGARLDGVLRADQAGYDGAVRDNAVYSILASEWPAAEQRIAASLRRP